jgi:hypothetical protein
MAESDGFSRVQEEDLVVPSHEQRLRFVEGRMGDAGSILHELVGHRGNTHYRQTTGRVGSLEETAKTHEDRLKFLEAEAIKDRILRRNIGWPFKEASNEVRENFDAGRPFTEVAEEQETRLDWRPGAAPSQIATEFIHHFPASRENLDEMRCKKQRVAQSDEDSEQTMNAKTQHLEQQLDDTQQLDNEEEKCDTQLPDDCEDK